MNAKGISVFYGSLDESTCIAEVRPPVGSQVVVARFEFLRGVTLLDLDALSRAYTDSSVFDPAYAENLNRMVFLRSLVREISRPVMPQDEDAEYLVTQVVAEYFASRATPRFDGVIFNSSQTGGHGRNLVLFHHATALEPSDLPPDSSVEVHAFADPEFEDSTTEFTIFETLPNALAADEPAGEEQQGIDKDVTLTLCPPSPESDNFFRLDFEGVRVITVEAVKYKEREHPVTHIRQTAEEVARLERIF